MFATGFPDDEAFVNGWRTTRDSSIPHGGSSCNERLGQPCGSSPGCTQIGGLRSSAHWACRPMRRARASIAGMPDPQLIVQSVSDETSFTKIRLPEITGCVHVSLVA